MFFCCLHKHFIDKILKKQPRDCKTILLLSWKLCGVLLCFQKTDCLLLGEKTLWCILSIINECFSWHMKETVMIRWWSCWSTPLVCLCTEDYPAGTWLGDENNPETRVRCPVSPGDMLHISSNCRTPEKMALTLLDYLFHREVQAVSNLSGQGKHGKKQLDPLMIYGIRCECPIQKFTPTHAHLQLHTVL